MSKAMLQSEHSLDTVVYVASTGPCPVEGDRISQTTKLYILSLGKDELKLIINKNKTNKQRQIFVVFTTFERISEVLAVGKEVGLNMHEVLVLQVAGGKKIHLEGKVIITLKYNDCIT